MTKKLKPRDARSFLLQAMVIRDAINAAGPPNGTAIAFVMDRYGLKDPADAYAKVEALRPVSDMGALMLIPVQNDEHGARYKARTRIIQSPDMSIRSALINHVMLGYRDLRQVDAELRRAHGAPLFQPADQRRNTALDKGRVLTGTFQYA